MAKGSEINEQELMMHLLLQSLPHNVVKQVTQMSINPSLTEVVQQLELTEQQMRQLGKNKLYCHQTRTRRKKV